jgi:hypothetical protein
LPTFRTNTLDLLMTGTTIDPGSFGERVWMSGIGCRSLGLPQYEAAFRQNETDGEVLPT